jgi:1,4-dihydroxy-2-naphthoate octaprenyltransferase
MSAGGGAGWWGTVRGPFLLLTPACVALGLACGWLTRPAGVDAPAFAWLAAQAWLAALAGHISVNMLNEWVDARSGLDALTQRTPFSGGSGTLQARPELLRATLAGGALTFLLALGLGLHLLTVWPSAWRELAPLGALGLALVAAYSPWIARQPWLCLVAPGLGFGAVMVAGTACVVSGHHSTLAWWAAAVPFWLVNNLLLLNQFPDVDADRAVGRRTLPIVLGRPACVRVAWLQWALAYGAILAGVGCQVLPTGALWGCLTLPLAWRCGRAVGRHADDMPALVPHLGANVAVVLLTPVLMALGMCWPR